MKKMFRFLGPYKKAIAIALSLMLIELIVELWHPLMMRTIIDDGILEGDMSVVIRWGAYMIGLSFVAFAAGIINSFYAARVSQGFGFDVRSTLFEKIQTFSFANLNKIPTPSLITRMTNDVSQIQNLVFAGLRIMLRAPLLIVGGVITALFVNFQLAFILFVCIPLLITFLIWIMRKGVVLFRHVQDRLDKVNGVMRENLAGMRLIKAYLRRKHELSRFTFANENLRNSTIKALRLVEIAMPILLLIMNLSIIVILWFGNIQVNVGTATTGDIVALFTYATRITMAFGVFSFIIMGFSQAKASAARINEVLDEKVDLVDTEESSDTIQIEQGSIRFDHVSFQYPSTERPVIKNISFQIPAGQTFAMLGATGSGKSSLFQLIPRLYDVDSGSISIDDHNILQMKLEHIREEIGFVPQEILLFSGTIKDNISWGKEEATMEEIISAAQDAQIHETIMKLPQGYDTIIGQKGVNLSGGQKQRISIARALIKKPKILLLDDCTSALDLTTEAKLLRALKKYTSTTLIITQKISTVMEVDSILLLDNGEIIDQGNHEQLIHQSELYQKIFESQFGEEGLHHAQQRG